MSNSVKLKFNFEKITRVYAIAVGSRFGRRWHGFPFRGVLDIWYIYNLKKYILPHLPTDTYHQCTTFTELLWFFL